MRAGDERVCVEEGEGLGVLALCVALEFLAAHREGLEEAQDGHRRTSLRAGVLVRRGEGTRGTI